MTDNADRERNHIATRRHPDGDEAHHDLPPERLLTVMDVAHCLGISRDSVFALLRTGELKSLLIRKRARRITPAQLNEYLADLQQRQA
ncbi:helix-turn-helix domain-containing protein [Actinomadura sp. 9N215]|uniref:helix-turn-helix domain-containing protein n=1 Tax=Actinomadura sp. 9N215 TaxID=3375150 RepID=UPI0037AE3138